MSRIGKSKETKLISGCQGLGTRGTWGLAANRYRAFCGEEYDLELDGGD